MIKARVRKPIPWKKIIAPTLAAVAAIGISVPVTIAIMKKNQSSPVAAQHTIIFEDCFPEKSTITYSKVANGEKAVMPLPEHHDNYGFTGWKTADGKIFDFMNTPITSNLHLYGAWIKGTSSDDNFELVETEEGTLVRLSATYWDNPIENIVVPAKIGEKTIVGVDESGFFECPAQSISLPDTIKYFSYGSFADCANLKILNMPKQLKAVGSRCFQNCYKLADITFSEGLEIIGEEAFLGSEETAGSPDSYIRSITMPSTLKYIGKNAFKYNAVQMLDLSPCKDLELAESAFEYTINLRQIILPTNLKYIPANCFSMSTRIRELFIPKSVKYIDDNAFSYCYRLRKLEIEEGSNLLSIGKYGFMDCHSLESLVLPKTLKFIGDRAFNGCKTLSSVTFKQIQTWDVNDTGTLIETFTPDPNNTKWNAQQIIDLTSKGISRTLTIKGGEYNDVRYLTDNEDKCVIIGLSDQGSSKKQINIPAKILATNPITNQNQEFDVIGISSNAFANNFHIETVTFETDQTNLQPNLQYILENAFSGCTSLTSINLSDCKQLNYIGDYAFKQCFLKESPQSGDLISFDLSGLPITYIGREAFEGVASDEANASESIIKSIKLPTSITFLGAGALYGLVNLQTLSFEGCSNLESIGRYKDNAQAENIPLISPTKSEITIDLSPCTKLTYLPRMLFAGSSKITQITLPKTIKEIYNYAFQNCGSLKTINISDDCVLIRKDVFTGCEAIEKVALQNESIWDLYNGESQISYTADTEENNAAKIKATTDYTWIKR